MIDLESLRCFELAAVHLNFRTAARVAALSPSAFSERIRRLEEDVGAKLFKRTTRGVSLTRLGNEFLPRAKRCLFEARSCTDVFKDEQQRSSYELTVGVPFNLGMKWLVPSLQSLQRLDARRVLHLRFSAGTHLLEMMETAAVDAVITSEKLTLARLAHVRIHEENYDFVASPALVGEQPLSCADDALQHTLLDTGPDLPLFRYLSENLPAEPAWRFQRHFYLGITDAVRHRVMESAGVAVLPRQVVQRDLDERHLVRLLPEIELLTAELRLVWLDEHPYEHEMQRLATDLQELPLRCAE